MRAVWKYTAAVNDSISFDVPHPAHLLDVLPHPTGQLLDFYFLVNPTMSTDLVKRHFVIKGTGHQFSWDDELVMLYVRTVRIAPLVWHVFEVA